MVSTASKLLGISLDDKAKIILADQRHSLFLLRWNFYLQVEGIAT